MVAGSTWQLPGAVVIEYGSRPLRHIRLPGTLNASYHRKPALIERAFFVCSISLESSSATVFNCTFKYTAGTAFYDFLRIKISYGFVCRWVLGFLLCVN